MTTALLSNTRLQPRRSNAKSAPGRRYFYWCLVCDHCLVDRSALCPTHKKEYDRQRKARQRERARRHAPVAKADIARLRDLAARCNDARQDLIDAINTGSQDRATYEKHFLDLTRMLIRDVRRLPDTRR